MLEKDDFFNLESKGNLAQFEISDPLYLNSPQSILERRMETSKEKSTYFCVFYPKAKKQLHQQNEFDAKFKKVA